MLVSVLVFYTLVRRNGFSKKEGLIALAANLFLFVVLIVKGFFSVYLVMQIIPGFFVAYCFLHFLFFCVRKSKESLNGINDLMGKRKRFKESQKVAETNKNVKTYKGAKKK